MYMSLSDGNANVIPGRICQSQIVLVKRMLVSHYMSVNCK